MRDPSVPLRNVVSSGAAVLLGGNWVVPRQGDFRTANAVPHLKSALNRTVPKPTIMIIRQS